MVTPAPAGAAAPVPSSPRMIAPSAKGGVIVIQCTRLGHRGLFVRTSPFMAGLPAPPLVNRGLDYGEAAMGENGPTGAAM